MAAPKTTIWELEPHTRAKHEILKRYLQAWAPILSQGRFRQILYIDGFSGPGRYSKGEAGSPIIALNATLEQKTPIRPTALFLFVEKSQDRAETLRQYVDEIEIPNNFRIKIAPGETFEGEIEFENSDQLRSEAHRAYWVTWFAQAKSEAEEEDILLEGLEATLTYLVDGRIRAHSYFAGGKMHYVEDTGPRMVARTIRSTRFC